MTDKTYVSMEVHMCPACGHTHDTGTILVHNQLKEVLDKETVTGMSICARCKPQAETHVLMVEADPKPGTETAGKDTLSYNDAELTGRTVWISKEFWRNTFDTPVPNDDWAFASHALVEMICKLADSNTTH